MWQRSRNGYGQSSRLDELNWDREFFLKMRNDYNNHNFKLKGEKQGNIFCYNTFKSTATAAFCIMYEANRIPLEQHPLWDFPIIKFHVEYKHRFLFIANIHRIMLKSLACGYMMRITEGFLLQNHNNMKGNTDLDLGLVRWLKLTLLDLEELGFGLLQ